MKSVYFSILVKNKKVANKLANFLLRTCKLYDEDYSFLDCYTITYESKKVAYSIQIYWNKGWFEQAD